MFLYEVNSKAFKNFFLFLIQFKFFQNNKTMPHHRQSSGKKVAKPRRSSGEYKKRVGSKVEVYRGVAMCTSGGLHKADIMQVKTSSGETRYVSRRKHELAKHNPSLKNWSKAAKQLGYLKKGADFKPLPKRGTKAHAEISALANRM